MGKIMNAGFGIFKADSNKDLTGQIRKKAYELYEKSGRKPGRDRDNWLEAERIIKQKARFWQ